MCEKAIYAFKINVDFCGNQEIMDYLGRLARLADDGPSGSNNNLYFFDQNGGGGGGR